MSTKLEQKLNLILKEKETKILPENIKKDVKILGVVGTLESDKPDQTKTVTPTTEEQVITPDAGYELSSVTVGAVTSDIDSNIQAENIKKDISILGVTGTLESGGSSDYNAKIENYTGGKINSALTAIPELETSSVTNMEYMFQNCTHLTTIPLLNTSNVTNMAGMFIWCESLTEIPELDTRNVTSMQQMFYSCSKLTTIPQLDTSNVTNMGNMFAWCNSLSYDTLNNILAMCINATSYITRGTNMTLKYLGLSETQTTKCQSLSNYQAFLDAGWTTGY